MNITLTWIIVHWVRFYLNMVRCGFPHDIAHDMFAVRCMLNSMSFNTRTLNMHVDSLHYLSDCWCCMWLINCLLWKELPCWYGFPQHWYQPMTGGWALPHGLNTGCRLSQAGHLCWYLQSVPAAQALPSVWYDRQYPTGMDFPCSVCRFLPFPWGFDPAFCPVYLPRKGCKVDSGWGWYWISRSCLLADQGMGCISISIRKCLSYACQS